MAGNAAAGPAEQQRWTVLVVEDDPNHQLLIRTELMREGSPFSLVQVARDSAEAERYSRQMAFDCLVVDNRIPGKRGLDLIATLQEGGIDAPFVLMTSVGTEDLAVTAYRRNVSDYVIKEAGFWREIPQIAERAIAAHTGRKREARLRERLERANARLERLNTDMQEQNQKLRDAQTQLQRLGEQLSEGSETLRASAIAITNGGDHGATAATLEALSEALSAAGTQLTDLAS